MKDFKYWESQFKQGKMDAFNADAHGLLWLKLKSIIRKDFVIRFANQAGVTLNQGRVGTGLPSSI